MSAPAYGAAPLVRPATGSAERFARAFLALFVFSGSFVLYEPSPYELIFLPTILLFLLAGLRLHASSVPLVALLVLFNIGGAMALPQVIGDEKTIEYVMVSIFAAANAIFFAALITTNTLERFAVLRTAYIASAVVAALLAVAGYFDIGGTSDVLTIYGRAKGLFKDPNVYGPFLILPLVLMLQDMLLGRQRNLVYRVPLYLLILLGLFLSFSRAAWVHVIASSALAVLFLLIFSNSTRLRLRVVFVSVVGAGVLVLGLGVVINIPAVGKLFKERASLSQQYDVAEGGRFSNQARSLGYILERPLGLGPRGFSKIFPSDPHNVYLNAFFAYGWLGAFSYFATIALTWIMGFWALFQPSPYRRPFGAVMATFTVLTLEGFIIDTDHWRHFFLLLGLVWGFVAAVIKWSRANPRPARSPSSP